MGVEMRKLKYLLIIVVSLFVISCGGSSSSTAPSGPSAMDYLEDGWQEFDSKNFENSLDNFQSAVDKNSSLKEGYIGIAVTYIESSQFIESEAVTVLENNVISNASDDNLDAAQAILLGIKMKDISETDYIYDSLYSNELSGISSGWNYSDYINGKYGTNIDLNYLKGYMINLSLTEVLIRDESYLSSARSALDKVLNYSGFGSLPSEVQTRANSLDSQLITAGY